MRKKIGIELNGIVRDINKQYLKYYTKDINQEFDDSDVDTNVVNLIDSLEFESKYEKNKFIYEDYPYELFGCAPSTDRNLHAHLNGWIYDLYWKYWFDDVTLFSLDEDELSIQSTYFFLSKSGSRVRNMKFPRKPQDVWKDFDIVITTNKDVVKSKPADKIVILIKKTDNSDLSNEADFSFNSLEELMGSVEFAEKLANFSKPSIFTKIKNNIKKIFI